MKRIIIFTLLIIICMGCTVEAAGYPEWRPDAPIPERPHLTRSKGTFGGPSGKETWYNLNMNGCVAFMRKNGYDEETYNVWIREDGAKMFGPYVMCGANVNLRPKGTILETSLGMAIVVDKCEKAHTEDATLIDLAVDW